MILFLDFDGVLHPAIAREDTVFCCLPHLWSIMRARPAVQVVFSSSWRETFDPEVMLDFVTANGGEDLLDRFVGSNPVLRNVQVYQREAECLAWLRGNGMRDRRWLALDDAGHGFQERSRHLYLVDHQSGLQSADVPRILKRIG